MHENLYKKEEKLNERLFKMFLPIIWHSQSFSKHIKP